MGDHGEFGREPFDVFGLLHDEAHRDQEGKVGVLHAMLLETGVKVALD